MILRGERLLEKFEEPRNNYIEPNYAVSEVCSLRDIPAVTAVLTGYRWSSLTPHGLMNLTNIQSFPFVICKHKRKMYEDSLQ